MQSMLKSYQKTSNIDFYDNLHRKYFNKAKSKEKTKGKKHEPVEEQKHVSIEVNSPINETNLFDLTEQSNTLLLGTSKSTVLN